MARTSAFSGKYGDVWIAAGASPDPTYGSFSSSTNQFLEVVKWSFDPKCNVIKYLSNKTSPFKGAIPGIRDGSGKVEAKFPRTWQWMFQDGDPVVLILHADKTGANYFYILAIVEGTPVQCDIDGGEAVSLQFEFQVDGGWEGYGIFSRQH